MNPNRTLIVGCGDIGQRIAQRIAPLAIYGLVQSPQTAARLQTQGITPITVDLDNSSTFTLPAVDTVYYCAPPPNHGITDPRIVKVLTALIGKPDLLYISTSAVYGDCQGRWIDESEPLNPKSERGHRRVAAELAIKLWAAERDAKTVCLRVPGIYGPGRLPRVRLMNGTPILRQEDSPFTNRIHADDLADACILALQNGIAGSAYNVSDEHPTSMTDYLLRAAALLGFPPPPQVDMATALAQFSPMLRSFLEESKRLRGDRLRALGFCPRYPNLEAGLPSCV